MATIYLRNNFEYIEVEYMELVPTVGGGKKSIVIRVNDGSGWENTTVCLSLKQAKKLAEELASQILEAEKL